MPNIDAQDLRNLAYPKGLREQYSALAWESQRVYFFLMIILGAFCFLLGSVL